MIMNSLWMEDCIVSLWDAGVGKKVQLNPVKSDLQAG